MKGVRYLLQQGFSKREIIDGLWELTVTDDSSSSGGSSSSSSSGSSGSSSSSSSSGGDTGKGRATTSILVRSTVELETGTMAVYKATPELSAALSSSIAEREALRAQRISTLATTLKPIVQETILHFDDQDKPPPRGRQWAKWPCPHTCTNADHVCPNLII